MIVPCAERSENNDLLIFTLGTVPSIGVVDSRESLISIDSSRGSKRMRKIHATEPTHNSLWVF